MAKTVIFAGGIEAFTSSSTARHCPFGNTKTGPDSFSASTWEIEFQGAGTLSDLSVGVYVNNRSGVASSTAGPYINGSISAVTVTIPIGTTGRLSDTSNTASVTANDDLTFALHPQNGGGGSVQLGNWSCVFDQTSGSVNTLFCNVGGAALGIGTRYAPIVSGNNNSYTTEADANVKVIAGTFSRLTARSSSNTRNGDSTIAVRKNSGAGSQTITIPASTSGTYTDSSNTDTAADNDDLCFQTVRGGTTGTLLLQFISMKFAATGDATMAYLYGDAAFAPGSATDYFFHIGGQAETGYTDALTKQLWTLDNFEASRTEVNIPTNSVASASAYVFRLNGSDSALSITIPSSTTGRLQNTSDTVALADGDEINFKLAAGGSGNITFRQSGIKFAPVSAIEGDAAQTLEFLSQSAAGEVLVEGDAAQELSFLTQALDGTDLTIDYQFNFRQTSGYVTDVAGQTYVLGEAYPTTRDDITFGWDVNIGNSPWDGLRDRNAGVDPRFAGVNQRSTNDGDQITFRADLKETGWHRIRVAIGDYSFQPENQYVEFKDGTDSITIIEDAGNSAANKWIDATGVERTDIADWIANNAYIDYNFTTTEFYMLLGTPSAETGRSAVAHLRIEKIEGSAGEVTGDIAQTLPMLSQAAAGEVLVEGDAAQVLPMLSQAASGQLEVQGAIAQTLVFLSQSAAGQVLISGQAAQTLPFLAQSLSGSNFIAGDIEQTLNFLSSSLTGDVLVQGDAAQVLPFLSQSLSGANVSAGNIEQTLTFLSQSAGGKVLVQGQIAQVLPLLSQVLSGSVSSQGAIVQTLRIVSQSASGQVLVEGDIAQALPMLSQNLTEAERIIGHLSQQLSFLSQSLVGSVYGDVIVVEMNNDFAIEIELKDVI